MLSASAGNNVPSFVQVGTISFRNSETVPLYRKATKNLLLEQDNSFSLFAQFLGAELKQKTAVTPLKVYDGSLLPSTNIMPEQSEDCNIKTKEN